MEYEVDYIVLDEESEENVMIERTWEFMGRPAMIHSLGNIGMFKG